jgi:TatD DNase family protein
MEYIDIHCHLDFPDYANDARDVIAHMKELRIGAITIGTDLESAKRAVALAEAYENMWACIGVHPVDEGIKIRGGFDEQEFDVLMQSTKVVAIGECGLDYFRDTSGEEKERQIVLFKQQIDFAIKYNKPLMLHCRNAKNKEEGKAYEDTLSILEEYKKKVGDVLRGNAHFFVGTQDEAQRFLDIGFTVSFTGVLTFTHDYDELVRKVPLESIHAETDAPFVAPVPHRGSRNSPEYVGEVVQAIARIKGLEVEVVKKALYSNAQRVFGLRS